MSKITLERSSWGDYTAYINGVEFETTGVKLDRAELLEAVLAQMGIEVETRWHYYVTRVCVRVDDSSSNMKEKL